MHTTCPHPTPTLTPPPSTHTHHPGDLQPSPITGALEPHFTNRQRVPRYLLSAAALLVQVALACALLVAAFNLSGLITEDMRHLYIPALGGLAAKGGLLSKEGGGNALLQVRWPRLDCSAPCRGASCGCAFD